MDIQQARELLVRRVLSADAYLSLAAVEGNHFVRVADEALRAHGVLGLWIAELAELPITGWQIDSAAQYPEPSTGYGVYSVDELVALRPIWVVPLVLGEGWSFHCDDDTLVDVLTPDGQLVSIEVSVIHGAE
jgi:hypothetical protein